MTDTIVSILKKFGIGPRCSFEKCNVQWKIQSSDVKTILFYNFNQSSSDEIKLFKKRIEKKQFLICITNCHEELELDRVYSLNNEALNILKEMILDIIYPYDFLKIKMIGITGTNGKTTTVDLIRQLALQMNKEIITIGTLGIYVNSELKESFGLTSPNYIDLRKFLYLYGNNVDIIAMELSSIGIDQKRTGRINFDTIGWTNFSQDHLDYHGTMKKYFTAKSQSKKLLKPERKIIISNNQENIYEGMEEGSYIKALKVNKNISNSFFNISYNLENLELALSCLDSDISYDFRALVPPPGRLNIIKVKDINFIIDYAHTPDALESVTGSIKKAFSGKLITIFGCGGDRDKLKRPLMRIAAEKYSDAVVVTSDNSRFEEPLSIISDVLAGSTSELEIILDREKAIVETYKKYKTYKKSSVTILIAGKGHESYLDIKGVKEKYSDIGVVEKLKKKNNDKN